MRNPLPSVLSCSFREVTQTHFQLSGQVDEVTMPKCSHTKEIHVRSILQIQHPVVHDLRNRGKEPFQSFLKTDAAVSLKYQSKIFQIHCHKARYIMAAVLRYQSIITDIRIVPVKTLSGLKVGRRKG